MILCEIMPHPENTPEEVAKAIDAVKQSKEFKAVINILPYVSSKAQEQNGTLAFQAPGRKYLIYQDGQARGWPTPEISPKTGTPQPRKNIDRPYRILSVLAPAGSKGPAVYPKAPLPDDLKERYIEVLKRLHEFLTKRARAIRAKELS